MDINVHDIPEVFLQHVTLRSQVLPMNENRSHILNRSKMIPLVDYLFARLKQLGIKSIHGVPGDYNLVSLDYIEGAGLAWVGDANELNAGEHLSDFPLTSKSC